jgi:hypothetical protein
MAMGRPKGYWFEDPRNPGMARWFDGQRPTEHVVKIASLPEGTPPPAPLDRNPFEPQEPERWAPPQHPEAQHLAAEAAGEPVPDFLWGSETPWWATMRLRIAFGAGATVVVLVVALVLHLLASAPPPSEKELTASLGDPAATYDDQQLVDAATKALALVGNADVSLDDLEAFLPLTCTSAEMRSASRIAGRLSMFRYQRADLTAVVRAIRSGARLLCPASVDRYPSLFDELPSMVLTAEGTVISYGGSGGPTGLNGVANAPGTVVRDGPASATGSSTVTVTNGSTSASGSVDVVRVGQSCSAEGSTASVTNGGTAVCSAASVCSSTGSGLVWRSTTSC